MTTSSKLRVLVALSAVALVASCTADSTAPKHAQAIRRDLDCRSGYIVVLGRDTVCVQGQSAPRRP